MADQHKNTDVIVAGSDADLIDLTDVALDPNARTADPAMAVVVALENEMQKAYAATPEVLEQANRTLRKANGLGAPHHD